MKAYIITAACLLVALAVPVTMAHREKAREAEARRLVSEIHDAAFRAQEFKREADSGRTSALAEYSAALTSLQRLESAALQAGADADAVTRAADLGRWESKTAELDRQSAKLEAARALIVSKTEATREADERFKEINEEIRQAGEERKERERRDREALEARLREIEHGPEAKPSSVPGLPPGVEPSGPREAPPGMTRGK